MTQGPVPRSLKIGSTLTFVAGLFAFLVATYFLVELYVSVQNPSGPFYSGQLSRVPYSLDQVKACNETLALDLVMGQQIEFANVMNGGFMVMMVTWFGLRRRLKWAWFALLGTFVWVGLNDTLALIEGHQTVLAVIPESLGLIGLAIAYPAVFGGGDGRP